MFSKYILDQIQLDAREFESTDAERGKTVLRSILIEGRCRASA